MSGRRADWLACLGAAVLLVASGFALAGAISAEPWVRYALRLEAAEAPVDMPGGVRDRLGVELTREDAPSCGWDLPEARVTVALELLRRSRSDDPGSSARAEAQHTAERTVRWALGCNAADGNLWYLMALLEQRAGADWARVQELLALSAALSPYEADLQIRRSRLVSWELTRDDVALPLDLEADLRRTMATARVGPAAAILRGLREGGPAGLADELVAGLPEARRQALEAGTGWRRSTFGRPERYRRYDYRPFGEPDR
ncbi:hypothetical protein D3218_16965 [Aureimonas flava]|uniref:Uncharacterized protein n=1 Tax=Aureimonas flava TaxID=2320271 RepID=A0A3A1WPN1_9HYPH|nr:hypothetical protein [Aureimonas flava]RIX98431.1 hypothetical protein D3218_16965 [Aureimonas flava]